MKKFKLKTTVYQTNNIVISDLLFDIKQFDNKELSENDFDWDEFTVKINDRVNLINCELAEKIILDSRIENNKGNLIHILFCYPFFIISCEEYLD